MDFKKIFSAPYMFDIHYAGLTLSDKLFFLIGAICLVLAIILKIAAKLSPSPIDAKYRGKFFTLLLTVGLWEVLWFGCRFEQAMFFGSHFVALLGVLVGAIWFVVLLVNMIRHYHGEKQAWDKEQLKLKYLPR